MVPDLTDKTFSMFFEHAKTRVQPPHRVDGYHRDFTHQEPGEELAI
jgi:hypothetical protein